MLQDLNRLGLEAKKRSDDYDKGEFVFSDNFKSKFNELLPNYNITFYKYTSVVKTSTNLIMIVPNQWFVVGSFFNDYISALKIYKNIVNELKINKETIGSIRENKIIDSETEIKINNKIINTEEAERFKKFLTDYDWWFGSKTIDRSDYFVSSILSLASVVNNSQSYIADLAVILSGFPELIEILNYDYESNLNQSILKTAKETNTIIQEKFLRNIILETFKFILNKYGEDNVLKYHEFKDSKIENRPYKGLMLPNYFGFEIIFAIFDNPLDIEKLKSSNTKRYFEEAFIIFGNNYCYFTTQWNENNDRGLTLLNFNKFLDNISKNSLEIIKENNVFKLVNKRNLVSQIIKTKQKIYFGPPGTGKSHAIKEYLKKYNVSKENYSRVTFHPDYDYHSFVGGYKPYTDINDNDKIKYKFVPQIFTELYVKAWSNQDEHYFLVIEEINRGNCSEIFGDIFQLLDRNPEYNIEPSSELRDYLSVEEEKINVERIENGEEEISLLINGKLQMPDNLSILASMNTSDQSLYPMDSAFKRRWEWKYVPIDTECKDSNFVVKIKEDKTYSWLGFIDKVNRKIYSVTKSEDKQIGNWFIDASKSDGIISKEIFINKVLFYLWNDVFKDETYHQDTIFVQKNDDGTKIKDLSFNDFHKEDNQDDLLIHLFEKVLGVTKAEYKTTEPKTYTDQENTMSIAAEPSEDENDSE